MEATQAQIEASESLLSSTTSFASGAFLLSEASDLRSAKSAVSILDRLIQKAKDSGMENLATIMEAFKGNIRQDMELDELRWAHFFVINMTIFILENKAEQWIKVGSTPNMHAWLGLLERWGARTNDKAPSTLPSD